MRLLIRQIFCFQLNRTLANYPTKLASQVGYYLHHQEERKKQKKRDGGTVRWHSKVQPPRSCSVPRTCQLAAAHWMAGRQAVRQQAGRLSSWDVPPHRGKGSRQHADRHASTGLVDREDTRCIYGRDEQTNRDKKAARASKRKPVRSSKHIISSI